ncbi:MAG: ABC transporter permease subunit [Clostridium sp.]
MKRLSFVKTSLIGLLILVISSWYFIFIREGASLSQVFSEKNLQHTKKFIEQLLGVGDPNPAFSDWNVWKTVLGLTYETLIMSILAIGFATIGMIFTVVVASRTYRDGTLTLQKKWYGKLLYFIIRGLYIFTRAVPELIWAMIIVFILKPGILPGAIALALHNFGILGKLCAEVIEDLDLRPIRNLSSSGAGNFEILTYGVIPMVTPKFITFILYRWEVIIRTTIVVGFVGAGGLGQEFKLAMSWFNYTEVTLILICYILLVTLSDILSEGMRKIAK